MDNKQITTVHMVESCTAVRVAEQSSVAQAPRGEAGMCLRFWSHQEQQLPQLTCAGVSWGVSHS